MRRAVYVARIRKKRNAYRSSVGKPKRKRQLLRNKCRLENKIRINLRERGWCGVVWSGLISLKIRTTGGLL
jgi:hypothetical protein